MATKAEPKETAVQEEKKPAKKLDMKEMVKIRLSKDRSNNADLFVGVNGYTALIKRGVVVEVPRYVARVIERSIEQDQKTADMIERISRNDL